MERNRVAVILFNSAQKMYIGEMMLFMARSKSEVIGTYTIWKNTSVLAQFSPDKNPAPSCQTERMNLSSAWMERFCWTKCHDSQAEKLKLKPVMLWRRYLFHLEMLRGIASWGVGVGRMRFIQKTFGAVWQLGTEGLRRGLGY